MSESKSNKNPTYALGTLLWVKLLKRVWWPGTVVDPLTIPQELKEYVKKVEPISCVVKFKEEDDKYHVVELNEEVYLYSCHRKIEFIEKGLSLYENQMKGFAVVGKFDMEFFKKEVISIEKLIGGDECIFKNLKEEKEKFKSIVKEIFTPTNTRKSKKKEVERKSLPAPKLPKTPKTPNQPKPKPVSKPRTSIQSQVDKTNPTSTDYSCYSEAGCNFTTNRYDNLKRHVASHKKDKYEVTTSKLSNSSTPNKRENLKTKPSVVKKQKLQEDLLKDWDNVGEDEDEEINTSGVQSSSNFAQSSNEEVLQAVFSVQSFGNVVQSSNEEVLQTIIGVQSSGNVVQSSNEEIVQTMTDLLSTKNLKTKPSVVKKQKLQEDLLKDWDNDGEDEDEEINTNGAQSSSNFAQSSNEEVLQVIFGVQSFGNVVQSSNEEVLQTMTDLLSTKNLKTKPSVVKKQKLQEELLKDWDNDGEDEDEEINTSGVQSSSNFAQSSNEEVLQVIFGVQSFGNVVQSSNEEVLQTMTDLLSTKNLKTKPSVVKKQKLQEELLKDWDNDGEDEDEEINTSGVQSSSNFAQSSNEEVLQVIFGVQSFGNVVQSSNEEVLQTMTDLLSTKNLKTKPSVVKKQKLQEELLKDWDNDGEDEDEEINTSGVQSSSNFAQSSNEEVLQVIFGVQSFGNVVQSSNEEVIPTSKVVSNKNDTLPIISKDISRNKEDQETSTCSPNKVFYFNENDNNTPVVELRQSKSDCSSTVDNDISETFESRITPDFINSTIFEASPSELVLVEKSTENVIDKPHGIQSNELVNEIDNQTNSTQLLLKKTDNTLDQINNFENSLSCISNSINNSDANILTEDDNVVLGESELSECGSLYKDTEIEPNDVGIPLVENMSTETEDSATVDEKVNQLNGTTIDENIPIENSCSVDSTSNKIDCEDIIIKKEEVPTADWFECAELKRLRSEIQKVYFVDSAVSELPTIKDDVLMNVDQPPIFELQFRSEIQDSMCRPCSTFGSTNYVFGDEYEVYIPKSLIGPLPIMEENDDPDRTAALYRAKLEKLFVELDLFDNKWTQHSSLQ